MTLRHALLATTMFLAPVAAGAQPVSGLYIAGSAGANWLEKTDFTPSTAAGRAAYGTGGARFEVGYAVHGSLGYGFGNGLRAEVVGLYLRNDPKSSRTPSSGSAPPRPAMWTPTGPW